VSGSDSISPTAHYTGHTWLRNGLSHPDLATLEGRILFESLHPVMKLSGAVGGPSLETYLLARHRAIDCLLERAIEEHGVAQVLEVAAGLSPRGWRFTQRYGERITYLEADLPAMAQRKRRALEKMGSLGEHHRVREVDALRDQGPGSLAALAAELDPGCGLAIITEGLLGYLDPGSMQGLWRRFARTLKQFPSGCYISDLHLGSVQNAAVRGFRLVLSAFVRGHVYLHFDNADEAEGALRAAGFARARVRPAWQVVAEPAGRAVSDRDGRAISERDGAASDRGSQLAHILEASTE
jgi:O-methyltransferase involved in polyketide biosynthesis